MSKVLVRRWKHNTNGVMIGLSSSSAKCVWKGKVEKITHYDIWVCIMCIILWTVKVRPKNTSTMASVNDSRSSKTDHHHSVCKFLPFTKTSVVILNVSTDVCIPHSADLTDVVWCEHGQCKDTLATHTQKYCFYVTSLRKYMSNEHMCCDLAGSVRSRQHWLWDIGWKRNEWMYSIVLRIFQLLVTLEPLDRFKWGFQQNVPLLMRNSIK